MVTGGKGYRRRENKWVGWLGSRKREERKEERKIKWI